MNGILSTLNDGATVPGNPSYAFYQGTSMVTPHIAGLAALLYERDPSLTPAQISQVMQDTARPAPGSCSGCGAGLADANAAVAQVGDDTPGENQHPIAAFDWSCNANQCSFENQSSDEDLGSVDYSWNFGDGNVSGEVNPVHVYPEVSENYVVTLTATDSAGLTNTATISNVEVIIPEEPPVGGVPNAPSSVIASAIKEGKGKNATVREVSLTWVNNDDDQTGFQIQFCVETGSGRNKRCDHPDPENSVFNVPAGVTAWSDLIGSFGTRYQVRAVRAGEYSGWVQSNKI